MKIIAAVAILILVVLMCVGSYFANLAIMRPKPGKSAVDKQAQKGGDYSKTLKGYKNYTELVEAGSSWYKATDFRAVSLYSADGLRLVAREHVEGAGLRWVILVHGYAGRHREMSGYAAHYTKQGYSVLMPDLRSHGDSEGKVMGMGWLDRGDMQLWIEHILESFSEAEIVLHGHSMGGATVLMTSGEQPTGNVKAIVADCAYSDVRKLFDATLKSWFGRPPFPVMDAAELMFRLRGGYRLGDASAVKQVEKSVTPTLFIHGSADKFIPLDMVYDVYEAASCEKELLIVQGAGHACSQYEDGELYYGRVFNFLGRYVGSDTSARLEGEYKEK